MDESKISFAVIDTETTGVNRFGNDRILEIAIVHVDEMGVITEEWETLVNPNRDLGRASIHGLRSEHLLQAPTFEEIFDDVAFRICGRVVVGHNVQFDASFLNSELTRIGRDSIDFSTLCTLSILGESLEKCCDEFGIEHQGKHTALGDAKATAEVLSKLLAIPEFSVCSHIRGGVRASQNNGRSAPNNRIYTRRQANLTASEPPSFLSRIITRMNQDTRTGAICHASLQYQQLLDRALEDRIISENEVESLYRFAMDFGLTANQISLAHVDYLKKLARAAFQDGHLSESELSEIHQVSKILGCDHQVTTRAIEDAREHYHSVVNISQGVRSPKCNQHEFVGKAICFTGEFSSMLNNEPITREIVKQIAKEAGCIIKDGVSKGLDALVLADPNSMSGKAKKAREYGIRLLAEKVFLREIGVEVT